MSENPMVSIIMPVYNSEEYLSEAVESIINQTFRDFEFIIIDDGSSDGSLEIINNYGIIDKRIIIVINDNNLGIARSLNKGIELARGKYLARMDADDISLPGRFEKQITFLKTNRDIGVLGTSVEIINEHHKYIRTRMQPGTHNFIMWKLCFGSPMVHSTVVYRSKHVKKIKYSEYAKHAEDYDLWTRLIWKTKFANLQEPLLKLRKHDKNVSVQKFDKQEEMTRIIQKRVIEEISGSEVSVKSIKAIRNNDNKLIQENTIEAISVIFDLYHNFQVKYDLSNEEITEIKRDIVNRVLNIIKKRQVDRVFILSFLNLIKFAPIHLLKRIVGMLKNKIVCLIS